MGKRDKTETEISEKYVVTDFITDTHHIWPTGLALLYLILSVFQYNWCLEKKDCNQMPITPAFLPVIG